MTVYEIVNQKIKERLEEAKKTGKNFFWVKPWCGLGPRFPVNYVTKNAYRGFNILSLEPQEYITYKQLMDYKKTLSIEDAEKIKIRKGCHMDQVFFFKPIEVQDIDEDGKTKTKTQYVFRYYNVYNIENIEGLPSHYPPSTYYKHDPIKNVNKALESINAYCKAEGIELNIVENGNRNFYNPVTHSITCVSSSRYKNQLDFVHSLLHECIHSTWKNMERNIGSKFDTAKYSHEELVAQIGAEYLMNVLGVNDAECEISENNIAYIDGWLSYLSDKKKELITAGNEAQKAVEYFIEVSNNYIEKKKEYLKESVVK